MNLGGHEMKKIISFILLLVTAISLVSCGNKENAPGKDVIPETDKVETVNLEVVFSETGKSFMSYGGGNEIGFYDIIPRLWNVEEQMSTGEFDNNIVYIDYASQKRLYLCNDPSCRHDSESCNSYIKSSSNAVVFPAGKVLLCFRFGASNTTASKEDLCAIITMDLNGNNKRTIFLASNESFSQPLIVLSDGEKIYFPIFFINKDQNIEKRIISLDLVSGELEDVIKVPITYMLVSAYEDCMLFYDIETSTNISYSFDTRVEKEGLHGVSGVYKGNISIDLRYDVDLSSFLDVPNAKSIRVIISDLKNKTSKELGPFQLEEDHGAVGITDIFDNHVCISYVANLTQGGEHVAFNLDYETGEFNRNRLLFSNGGVYRPVTILANAGDSYLVYYGTTRAVQTLYDRQGIAHTVDNNSYPQYALIKKEDYYSNIPNYEIIKDTLCDVG